ncbi:cupin domain-containing protein [Protaetiibacter intestinalis]|uniref:Cupin domain-containing protein n=1 Tax=Protaetiibacter intestinalis TaxID=2419774 RepID=A0A387BAA7_9MICO|nr:cupin domain-containing protein [Protaetiibacter intestinalis]AYF97869.1 cupin domain-containing protein [Protaetiibacter intestinalis]
MTEYAGARSPIQRRGDEHHDWALYRGEGRVGIEWYFREASALPTSVMLYHLEPGTSEGEHLHLEGDPASCSVETQHELYLVVSGEVVMTVDGERAVLGPGDAVYVPEGVPHGVANETDAPAELVLLFGEPTGQTPYTVNPARAEED